MKICVVEPIGIPIDQIRAGLIGHEVVEFDSRGWDDEKLAAAVAGADILAVTYRPLSAAVINSLPDLKMIAVAFAGIDHVDAQAVTARNIVVRNAAGYANSAVAELVIGFMISLARSIPQHNVAIRNGGVSSTGSELGGKTIGIVGEGGIGRRVEELAKAFGMTPVVHDRDSGVSLPELFRRSDYVTLHVPLNSQTRGLVSAALLGLMKPTAFLINCARGPIVDAAALTSALAGGQLAGAALDVFDTEPPLPPDHPLLRFPNVIATPHIGFNTAEALVTKGTDALQAIQEFIASVPNS